MAGRKYKKGDTGTAVKRIQKHLKHTGYYTGELSGTFDDATETAVKAFQKANGLTETGIVDYKTLGLLATKSKEAGPIVVKKKEDKEPEQTNVTIETGRWNNHVFIVSAQQIMSFSDVSIKGSSALESKDDQKTGYVTRKGSEPTELSISLHLNAQAGVNVRDESMQWVKEAQNGATDYFYVGDKKLIEAKMMLTSAAVSKVEIAHNGTWVTAEVSLTFKQSNGTTSSGSSGGSGGSGGGGGGYSGGSSGYSGGGSQKVSVNSTSPTTPSNLPATVGELSFNHANPLFGKSSPIPTGVTSKTTQQSVGEANNVLQKTWDAHNEATKNTKGSGTSVVKSQRGGISSFTS